MRKIIILGIILFNIMGFASFSVEGGSFYCLKIKDVEENEKNEYLSYKFKAGLCRISLIDEKGNKAEEKVLKNVTIYHNDFISGIEEVDFNEKIIYGGPVRLLKYDSEKNEAEIFFHNPKSHTRTKQGINFSFMETVDQFLIIRIMKIYYIILIIRLFYLITMKFTESEFYKKKG